MGSSWRLRNKLQPQADDRSLIRGPASAADHRLSSAGETLGAASMCKDDCQFAHVRRGRFCLEVIWHGEWTCLSHAPSPIQP
jgi:hypothetical protein